jgi:hypothetical protein
MSLLAGLAANPNESAKLAGNNFCVGMWYYGMAHRILERLHFAYKALHVMSRQNSVVYPIILLTKRGIKG